RLLVEEVRKLLPCEACALHCFEGRHVLVLQSAAPDGSVDKNRSWDAFKPKDRGFMLDVATQREVFRGAGKELRQLVEKEQWEWLPMTKQLHSILPLPLADPEDRHYGLLTLSNQVEEEGRAGDALDFSSVPTQVRAFLQEIATHVLESLEARRRFARLAELAQRLQLHADHFIQPTSHG